MALFLRLIGYGLAGTCYICLGCIHGSIYWLMVFYISLEIIALFLEPPMRDDNEQDKPHPKG